MTDEHRTHDRRSVRLECVLAEVPGDPTISDISPSGCFVDTRLAPQVGAATEVTVTLGDVPTRLRGKVIHVQRGIGFGMMFTELDEPTRDRLQTLLSSDA